MHNADLIRMANQITAFFTPYSKAEALEGIAKHIHAFWDPRMRNQLKTYFDAGGKGLEPIFLEAAAIYFAGPKLPASKAPPAKPAKVN